MSGPSAPQPPFAIGGMSIEGTTTVVKINLPELDQPDKKVLCSAVCKCKDAPGTGKDGRSLKQACVSAHLKGLDEVLHHRSNYKPEVNYDMTSEPPMPIMDKAVGTRMHAWLAGWIKKYWELPDEHSAQRPPFEPGTGMVRRPDVVIVNDPLKPPTQDNIKRVVEIKFPPNSWNQGQRDAYIQIAGNDNKLVTLEPKDCDCDKGEPQSPKIPVGELGKAAAAAGVLYMLLTKRPPAPAPIF